MNIIKFIFFFLIVSIPINANATLGWQYEPSTKIIHINNLSGTLVIITDDGVIKFFDYDTHKLKKKLLFPESSYSRGHYKPSVSNIIHDQENLLIQTNQYFSEAKIFLLDKDGNINKIINLPRESRLITSDNNHFYLVESKTTVDHKKIITILIHIQI